jgi:hypothetical protein
MMVTEYHDRFLQLARYTPAEVAHDGDKQERFREGLDDHLEYALMNHHFDNFNQLVAALNTEHKRREIEDKKRKMAPAASGSNTRPLYQYQQRQQQYPPRPQQQQQAG